MIFMIIDILKCFKVWTSSACAWSFEFWPVVFFFSGMSVVLFDTHGNSRCHNRFFCRFIIGLISELLVFCVNAGFGNFHAEKMFRTTTEAKGECLEPVKHVTLPPHPPNLTHPVIYYWPFSGDTSVVVSQCYLLLSPCVYGFQQYGRLNNSCPLWFQFNSVL